MNRKLYRSRTESMVAGVCGGLAEYFNVDVVLVRIIAVILALTAHGAGLLAYVIFWVIVPQKPLDVTLAKEDQQEEEGAATETAQTERKNGILFIGVGLIILGALYLLNNFIPAIFFSIGKLWPVILIVLGFVVIKKGTESKEDES